MHLYKTFIITSIWVVFIQAGDISNKEIEQSININNLSHPYLVFSDKDKTEIIKRIKTDLECRDIMKRLMAEGNRMLYQPVDYNAPVQGKNTRADWTEQDRDRKYENYYRLNRDNSLTLAFLYQITGQQKYADKAFEFADALCDLPTWTMRAHEFPIIYSRVMPWNVPDDQVSFGFDHFNGDTGRDMAYVYDWLYPALNQSQRDRIRGALIEKVITRVRGNYEFHWWATAYRCNWCGVCNSGVGLAGLALLKEHPQFTDVISEAYNRISKMYNELGQDGGWQEGGSYWSYALRTSVQFAKALERITNGKLNLFKNDRLATNPASFPLYLYIPPGRSVNFADSHGNTLGPTYLLNLLAEKTGDAKTIWYRQNCLGEGTDWQDIVWPRPKTPVQEPDQKSRHFRTIDYWIMRTDFSDPDKVIVAGKAGKNNDPHHGHLDIGNVVVFWKGKGFISELPRTFYDEKYFDEARWDYPSASSEGHNVIFVNGEKQISGKYYKKPFNNDVGGKVLSFSTAPERDYVLMDPSKAYPQKELKNWYRHVILEKPDITLILDEITAESGAEIEARFHTEVSIIPLEDYFLLENYGKQTNSGHNGESGSGKSSKGTMVLIPFAKNKFTTSVDRHADLAVNAQSEFKWIPYCSIMTNATNELTVLATLIMPVEKDAHAQTIRKSFHLLEQENGLMIFFIVNNKEYTFRFSKEGKHLRFIN